MNKTYILYHSPCADGTGAKYAAWKKFGDNAEYFPVQYHKPMPHIEDGSDVYILDFSYSREELDALKARVNKLQVIDHHVSAQRMLEGVDYAIFDMTKSGAVLAWEYFHPLYPVPAVLKYIEDRDIWKWAMEGTKDVLNALTVYGNDVSTWDEFNENIGTQKKLGMGISLYQEGQVTGASKDERIAVTTFMGYSVALVNSTTLSSEIGNEISTRLQDLIDFTVVYFVTPQGTVGCGLRSVGTFDVSRIATLCGGGGHRNAAGCEISLEQLAALYRTAKTVEQVREGKESGNA